MAIDTSVISAAATAVDTALQELFAFADAQIKAATGETASYRGLKLTAHAVDERRVRELIVEVAK